VEVLWTDFFWDGLEHELDHDGRPTRAHFEKVLMPGVDLALRTFWGDPTITPVVDPDSGMRSVKTELVPPGMFPPGAVYALPLDENRIAVIGVGFDWDYWDDIYHEDIH